MSELILWTIGLIIYLALWMSRYHAWWPTKTMYLTM